VRFRAAISRAVTCSCVLVTARAARSSASTSEGGGRLTCGANDVGGPVSGVRSAGRRLLVHARLRRPGRGWRSVGGGGGRRDPHLRHPDQ
jgi:hypothetical protein